MALSMLDIPFPEDDDMSDDEFDGYITQMRPLLRALMIRMVRIVSHLMIYLPSQTSSSQRALRLT